MALKDVEGYSLKLSGPGLTLERSITEEAANKIMNLLMGGHQAHDRSSSEEAAKPSSIVTPSGAGVSAKQFLAQKKPGNNYERVACLAFYLTHQRGSPSFKTTEISRLNTEAAQSPMTNAAAFVRDATTKYQYLTSAGGGRKQVTTLGEAVVNALPDREKVKTAIADNRPRKGRRKKRKSK